MSNTIMLGHVTTNQSAQSGGWWASNGSSRSTCIPINWTPIKACMSMNKNYNVELALGKSNACTSNLTCTGTWNVGGFASHHTTGGSNRTGRGPSLISMKGRWGACAPQRCSRVYPLTHLRRVCVWEVEDDQVEVLKAQTLPKRVGLWSVGGSEHLIALPAKPCGAYGVPLGVSTDQQDGAHSIGFSGRQLSLVS
jgi:hypothetical protein